MLRNEFPFKTRLNAFCKHFSSKDSFSATVKSSLLWLSTRFSLYVTSACEKRTSRHFSHCSAPEPRTSRSGPRRPKDLAVLDVQNATQTATSAAATAAASSSGDTSGPAPMDVDTGTTFRLYLPQLNFASMNTRHAEIRVWSAYKEELTSWLCLLDDRFAEELEACRDPSLECLQRGAHQLALFA
eukprot:s536_g1.t1